MTTIMRKRNVAPIVLGMLSWLLTTVGKYLAMHRLMRTLTEQAAKEQVQTQSQAPQQAYDQQYKLPPSYEGKYYPNDDTSAIGYHGTSQYFPKHQSRPERFLLLLLLLIRADRNRLQKGAKEINIGRRPFCMPNKNFNWFNKLKSGLDKSSGKISDGGIADIFNRRKLDEESLAIT